MNRIFGFLGMDIGVLNHLIKLDAWIPVIPKYILGEYSTRMYEGGSHGTEL